MPWERPVRVIGVRGQFSHPSDCACEACGPVVALFLSEYEAVRLLDALERRDGADTGDWHAQLRAKLTDGIGRENLDESTDDSEWCAMPDRGPATTPGSAPRWYVTGLFLGSLLGANLMLIAALFAGWWRV